MPCLFTCGRMITAGDEDAIRQVPAEAWKPSTAQDGTPETDKDVAEITGLMTRAENWPGGLRWIARRVKPSRHLRNLTDKVLRQAAGDGRIGMDELDKRLDAVYAAKTFAELKPVTKDLPSHGTVTETERADLARFGGVAASPGVFAFWGGFSRKGAWVVPPKFSARAIMGGGELDLRDARFTERITVIRAVAVMGGIVITVPDDVEVQVTGAGVMGGFVHPAFERSPGAPVIIIKGLAFWGGVNIKRRDQRDERDQAE